MSEDVIFVVEPSTIDLWEKFAEAPAKTEAANDNLSAMLKSFDDWLIRQLKTG